MADRHAAESHEPEFMIVKIGEAEKRLRLWLRRSTSAGHRLTPGTKEEEHCDRGRLEDAREHAVPPPPMGS
jgi:hypothetical protein